MFYKKNDKYTYTTTGDILIKTDILVRKKHTGYIVLFDNGTLLIKKGYSWNGVNKPAVNSKKTVLPSLVHDSLYQLIKSRKLRYKYKKNADLIFYKLMRKEKVNIVKAKIFYWAVSIFGGLYL